MSLELPKSAFQSILDCIDMINSLWNIPTEKKLANFINLSKQTHVNTKQYPVKLIFTQNNKNLDWAHYLLYDLLCDKKS